MSDDRLAVPLADLEEFAHTLSSIKRRMNGTRKLFDDYTEDIGDRSVANALNDFESNWEDGREDIDQQLSGLVSMAETVVREVRRVDSDLAKELRKAVKEDGGKGRQAEER